MILVKRVLTQRLRTVERGLNKKLVNMSVPEDYTENLLHLHDAEIVRLRNYYDVHKELFQGVQKWEESWKLFLEFERKASDPGRFTKKRGESFKRRKGTRKAPENTP